MKKNILLALITLMSLETGLVYAMGEDGEPKTLDQQLRSAAYAMNMTEVVRLVKAGADPKTIPLDNNGDSFLSFVITRDRDNDLNAIPILIAAGLKIDHKNINGSTPLHHAALYKASNAIVVLIELGADKNVRNSIGQTPLDVLLQTEKGIQDTDALKAMITTVSPQEIQHVIPAIIALQKRKAIGGSRDVGSLVAAQLIPEIVREKLALAKKYLPTMPDAELQAAIIASINRVIKQSPQIEPSVKAVK